MLNLIIDNFFGIICKDIFYRVNNKLTFACGYTSRAVFTLLKQGTAACAVAATVWG